MALKDDMAKKAEETLADSKNISTDSDGRGRPPADERMVTKGYAIKPSEYEEIRQLVEATGDNMSAFVRRAVIQASKDLKRPRR